MSAIGDAAMVFLAGAGLCLAAGRVVVPLLMRAQCVAPLRYEDCPPLLSYQQAKPKTPTMGGLFLLGAGIAAAAAAGGLSHRDGWLVLGAVAGLGLVGWCDDWLKFRGPNARGLRSRPKLLVALAIGFILGVVGRSGPNSYSALEVPWLHRAVELGWGWIPFAMFVVAGCAHAVNLTDGMDGLAVGCVAIALTTLGVFALDGDARVRVMVPWCAALAGACAAFLWFNSHPASVFMGDVGALGLGGALGAISLLTHTALWLLLIGGVFVAEALSVMLQVASYRWRNKRRIFRVAPLHHHFQLGGISEPKLIVRFWLVGLFLAVLGLTTVRP